MRIRSAALVTLLGASFAVAACSVDVDLDFGKGGTPTPTLPPCGLTVPVEYAANAVYVSSTIGVPNAPGSALAPVDTIGEALTLLTAGTGAIFVMGGEYAEPVDISGIPFVKIFGSFSPDWSTRHEQNDLTILRTGPGGVSAFLVDLLLDGLEIIPGPGVAPSGSSYGLRLSDTSAHVNCVALRPNPGALGDSPALFELPPPPPPVVGDTSGGPGGTGCAGFFVDGGAGGAPAITPGVTAAPGLPGDTGLGSGGGGGSGGADDTAGSPGDSGADGAHGAGGPGGLAAGTLDAMGWIAGSGSQGEDGQVGHGGGGGGGGGWNTGTDTPGGAGGGGGGGGCAGLGAAGGAGGGGSIGVYLWQSSLTGSKLLIATSNGGDGGAGQPGGGGERGAMGALGGAAIPLGGAGGKGSNGGSGGGGGGGAGGPSVGIFFDDDVLSGDSVTEAEFYLGIGGASSPAGLATSGGNPGFAGEEGFVLERYYAQ